MHGKKWSVDWATPKDFDFFGEERGWVDTDQDSIVLSGSSSFACTCAVTCNRFELELNDDYDFAACVGWKWTEGGVDESPLR